MVVKAWREIVTIPTYEVGKAERNPMFLEKRVYQGSSGVVYPYPVIETISDEKVDKDWMAIWLENEYIKVMILPELGGRVQMAYDKVKGRHFVYYNHVIKPALVGLAGPWISGGIEFNWPQHHRPSTYMPVDSSIVENEDGSVTVWVNEMERMFHQKGAAGFTLHPGCAYLEIKGRVSNRTSLPQTFLWWANPAVEVNDAYQSVFPPDVNAVFDHGKRAVSSFPIATGTYYKMDYSAGVDISNYRNIPVPTSYMAVNSKYDFEGGYENDTKGGMLHVASHHYSPGKKQWTWGNGDFGRAWDRNLTDEGPSPLPLPKGRGADTPEAGGTSVRGNYAPPSQGGEGGGSSFRPYIELMAGVYTENQPDFSWLMPYEEKQFVQYFMPYREIGIVKQATKDFIFNIEEVVGNASERCDNLGASERCDTLGNSDAGKRRFLFKVLATSEKTVQVKLSNKEGHIYYNKVVTMTPEEVFEEMVDVKGAKMDDLQFVILSPLTSHPSPLLTWCAEPDDIRPIPDAAEAALPPQDTKTNDQLYLTGLHLEQYRHATWSALDYYEEALRRDPNDVRCLNQTGLWYLRRGCFDKAEPYLRKAVRIWQKRNPNPYDGEAIFNLALCLKYQYRPNEAYELFWKSTWNKAWADAGYFEAARISVSQGRYDDALDELDRCLTFNSCNHQARALKAAVLRKVNGGASVATFIEESLRLDRFNYGCLYEKYLLLKEVSDSKSDEVAAVLTQMMEMMHGNVYNYHELAWDYALAGLWQEAEDILNLTLRDESPELAAAMASPITYYYLGYFKEMRGLLDEALDCYKQAEQADSYCCFPNRLEDILVLRAAIAHCSLFDVKCSKAPYYLGCLYYDKRQYELAIENWELSAKACPSFPTVWRNLALGYFNKLALQDKALTCMEKAFRLDEDDARMLMELDQLYKRLHKPHAERLAFLQKYPELIQRRDDLVLEEITLLNLLGRYEEAMQKLDAHKFHPWEGGEGKVSGQYQMCRLEMAKGRLTPDSSLQETAVGGFGANTEAIRLLNECLDYPHHLGEGKLHGAQENDFYYLLGMAYYMKGEEEKGRECWEKGTVGPTEPAAAMYYNDAKPDKIFYAALCYRKLGREDKARGLFNKLINYGKQHIFDKVVMDYFAVSLPDLLIWDDSLDTKNLIHCKYMLALGYYGMGDKERAERFLSEVEALDNNHIGIYQLRTFIQMES